MEEGHSEATENVAEEDEVAHIIQHNENSVRLRHEDGAERNENTVVGGDKANKERKIASKERQDSKDRHHKTEFQNSRTVREQKPEEREAHSSEGHTPWQKQGTKRMSERMNGVRIGGAGLQEIQGGTASATGR